MAKVTKKSLVDNIISYESGGLGDKQTLELFSYLIKTGRVWSLQGHYGRTAHALISDGWINSKGIINKAKVKVNLIS